MRAVMLGSDPFPLAGSLLETPHPTTKIDKGQLLTFISGWAPRTVEQMSDLTTAYLPWMPSNSTP
jgi:hypothetical protein